MPAVDLNKPMHTNWSTRSMPVDLLDRMRIVAAIRSRGGDPIQIQQVLFDCLRIALPIMEQQLGMAENGEAAKKVEVQS